MRSWRDWSWADGNFWDSGVQPLHVHGRSLPRDRRAARSRLYDGLQLRQRHVHHPRREDPQDLDEDIRDKDVLIVEDIIDSGNTLNKVREILALRGPKSLAICTLLDKPERREVQVPVEYVGFSIPDEFVVGYGIDYAQRYRHLPYVGKVVLLDE